MTRNLQPTAELIALVNRALQRELWRGGLANNNDFRFAQRFGRMPNEGERRQLRELELLEAPDRTTAEANAVRMLTTRA